MLTVLPHTTFTAKRFGPSTNIKGTIQPGLQTSFTVEGSISAARPNDIARLEEGKRTRQAYILYTESALQTATPGKVPDWIFVNSDWYEITGENNWQNTVMSHHEYIITKIENASTYVS